MTAMSVKKRFVVVAAVISDNEGRLLLARRPEGTHMAGLWEFPGGKVEAGEDYLHALHREMNEELGISVSIERPLTFAVHSEANLEILILFFSASISTGVPVPREGQEIRWVDRESLKEFPMPPADDEVVDVLVRGQLSDQLNVSTGPD